MTSRYCFARLPQWLPIQPSGQYNGAYVGVPNQSSFLLFTLSFVIIDLPNYWPRTVNDRLSAAAVKRYFANTQISAAALIRVAALYRSFTISKNTILRFKSAETKYFAPPNRYLQGVFSSSSIILYCSSIAVAFVCWHFLLFVYIYISHIPSILFIYSTQGLFFTRPC